VDPTLLSEVERASQQAKSYQSEAVREALLPPLRAEIPKVPGAPVEPRFDLVVNSAAAQQVFMSIVSGTRYSMVVNPGVRGTVTVNLKDVTVREALEAIREVYGYEFRVDGTRIYVDAAGLQTRVFQVNYLIGLRSGRSDVRVSSGAISGNTQQGGGGGAPVGVAPGGAAQSTSPALGALGLSVFRRCRRAISGARSRLLCGRSSDRAKAEAWWSARSRAWSSSAQCRMNCEMSKGTSRRCAYRSSAR
jgi:hypothetical protein